MILLKKLLRWALALWLLLLAVGGGGTALAVLWPDPTFAPLPPPTPEEVAAFAKKLEQPYATAARRFTMPDGGSLAAQLFAAEGPLTILFVHGVLASSYSHNRDCGLLREATGAEVVAIDLRGHGASSGAPGDTAYAGQYEDDLGEVVRQLRAEHPERKLILAGHSMGGGIALRYAEKVGAGKLPAVDGYLLFAPHLGLRSQTTQTEATAESRRMVRVHVPRLLALAFLDAVGVHSFNGLRVLFFNLPEGFPVRSYTFRASAGIHPDDHRRALAAVDRPLLLVAGSADEAFKAEFYPEEIGNAGEVVLVPGANHDGVVGDARALATVAAWLEGSVGQGPRSTATPKIERLQR